MIFYITRAAVIIIIAVVLVLILKNKSKKTKLWTAIPVGIAAFVLLFVFPPERLIEFKTAENAYYYSNIEKIACVSEGENSVLVTAGSNGRFTNRMIQKSKNGYRMPGNFVAKTTDSRTTDEGTLTITRYSSSGDAYATGIYYSNKPVSRIVDSLGSEANIVFISETGGKYAYYFSVFVPEPTDDYSITAVVEGD